MEKYNFSSIRVPQLTNQFDGEQRDFILSLLSSEVENYKKIIIALTDIITESLYVSGDAEIVGNLDVDGISDLGGMTVSADGNVVLVAGAATADRSPLKFIDGVYLTTPEAGVLNYVGNKFCITNVATCRVVDRTSDVLLETVTVANTVDKTLIWTALMAANSLRAGNVLKFQGRGEASNTGNGLLTISIEVNDIEVTSIQSTARNLSDDDVYIDAMATQRTLNNGTDGLRAIHFDLNVGTDEKHINGVATIDTEDDMTVKIYATWSAASASNTFSLYQAFMEYKN